MEEGNNYPALGLNDIRWNVFCIFYILCILCQWQIFMYTKLKYEGQNIKEILNFAYEKFCEYRPRLWWCMRKKLYALLKFVSLCAWERERNREWVYLGVCVREREGESVCWFSGQAVAVIFSFDEIILVTHSDVYALKWFDFLNAWFIPPITERLKFIFPTKGKNVVNK